MFSLSQLIFIDSYSPKKRAKVCLQGNTNLNGDNGAGKTTMLRVLPLFFGAAPGQLVRQSGTNQSFVHYYLPRLTSYIIFEYEREGEKNLVVIFRRDQSLRICLLAGAYQDELFFKSSEISSNVINSTEWAKTMRLRGLKPTQAMSIGDYKNIIQNGRRFIASTDRKRKQFINENRSRFSYCHRGSSIESIDLIATAILEREPSIEAIKEILTGILAHAENIDNEIPQLSMNPAKLTAWINDKKAYQAMCDYEKNIKALNGLKFEYDENIKVQQAYRSHAEKILQQLNVNILLLETERNTAKTRCGAHEKKTQDKKRVYLDNKNAQESRLDNFDKQITKLEQEKDIYKSQNIANKERQVQQIPTIKKELSYVEAQYHSLTKDQQDIENKFETLKAQRTTAHQEIIINLQNKAKDIDNNIQKKHDVLTSEKAIVLEEEELKNNHVREEQHARLVTRKEEKAKITQQLTHITPRAELSNHYKQLEKQMHDLMMQTELFDSAIQQAQIKQTEHQQKIQRMSTQAEEKKGEQQRLESELEHLRQLKNPVDNNLLSFLRNNHSSWTSTIAKVVPELLLLRSDLSPEITDNNQTLYGVRLDLSCIETALAADEEQLQQKMLNIDGTLGDIEARLAELTLLATQLNKATKGFGTDLFQVQARRKQHKKNIADQQETLTIIQQEINQAIEKRKEELHTHLAKINNKIREEDAQIKTSKHDYQSKKETINQRYNRKNAELTLERDKEHAELKHQKQQAKKKTDNNIAELEQQKKSAFIEKGVDPEYLETLTNRLQQQKKQLEEAKQNIDVIEKYQRWFKHNWNEYDRLKTAFRHTNETLYTVEEKWKTQRKMLKETSDALKNKLSSVTKKYDQSETDSVLLRRLLEQYPDKGKMNTNDMSNLLLPNTPALLEVKWKKILNEERETAEKARSSYTSICRKINTFRESNPQKYLDRMTVSITSKYTHLKDEWLYATAELIDYMRQGHQDHLKMLHTDALLIGQQISDHYTTLKRTHDNINALGKKVTAQSEKVITSFAAISDFNVKVTSNLNKLDFWDALQKFSESHQTWKARSTILNTLPDEVYIERLKTVSTLIERSGVSIQLAKSFAVSFSLIDQGKPKVARTTKELKDISSNGLAYLILIAIYTALVNMLRGNTTSVMVWPVDELRNFSVTNAVKLMALLEQHHIYLFSAFPDPDPDLLKYYKNRYLIDAERTLVEYPDEMPDMTQDINHLLRDEAEVL